MRSEGNDPTVMHVFVHLAYGMGAVEWERRWAAGRKGMNDRSPYGYARAATEHVIIIYSEDYPERRLQRYFRLFLRFILGFDLVHAWRNRAGIMGADVVWTHTESQHLAIGLIFLLQVKTQRRPRPKMIGQSVWLFDNWKKYSASRRWFFKSLLRQSDVLTVHSLENLQLLRSIVPEVRSELVLYGVTADPPDFAAPSPRTILPPAHVLSVGNDRDRDWPTLVKALRDQPEIELIIASRTVQAAAIEPKNISVRTPATKAEIIALYDWADIVVVPLQPNLHASGITVIQEAAIRGVPVICTDTGGLRSYFDGDALTYVAVADSAAIRTAVAILSADGEKRLRMATRAQARMGWNGLSSVVYAQRHVELSRELLNETAAPAPAAGMPGAAA